MHFDGQLVIPAARSIKDYEELMTRDFTYIVLLDSHIAQLQSLMQLARQHKKKVLLHADLVQGLKHDESGAHFLCQVIRPHGLISTHSSVIKVATKHQLIAIQRIFLLDSHSLETSYRILESSRPDYIEVLPGIIPDVIREVKARTQLPILSGGFIRTQEDILTAMEAGVTAVTTSHRGLWEIANAIK